MTEPSLTYLRPEVLEIKKKLDAFVEKECIPAEREYDDHLRNRQGPDRWTADAIPPCLDRLKRRAKELGLWNLFIPPHLIHKVPHHDPSLAPSVALSYREYGILCESLGRCPSISPEACNASAPDTGNMEVLLEFGTPMQRKRYLIPLLRGDIRSTFLMTEPGVASSDPTNLETRLVKRRRAAAADNGGAVEYVLSGQKWWSTGAMDPRCRLALVVAKMDYSQLPRISMGATDKASSSSSSARHGAHTIVAVPLPHPSVVCERALTTFGYDDAPSGHAQVRLDGVVLTEHDLIVGEGSGFRVSQARLGPGRIHHCMRAVGIGTAHSWMDWIVEPELHPRTLSHILLTRLQPDIRSTCQPPGATSSCCSGRRSARPLENCCASTACAKK
jgi:acyl-CoA dehydrogenase